MVCLQTAKLRIRQSSHVTAFFLLAKGVDIRQTHYQQQLKLLQDRAPLLASFILKLPFEDGIPDDVCALINQLCNLALAPYKVVAPPFLPPPSDSKLSFFPNRFEVRIAILLTSLPPVDAIQIWRMKMPAESIHLPTQLGHRESLPSTANTEFAVGLKSCRVTNHQNIHSISSLPDLQSHQPPSSTITPAKLHQYCLNRQPAHFKNTHFFVDRFHWRHSCQPSRFRRDSPDI